MQLSFVEISISMDANSKSYTIQLKLNHNGRFLNTGIMRKSYGRMSGFVWEVLQHLVVECSPILYLDLHKGYAVLHM